MSRKYIMNIKFGKCQRELVNCFIFTPRPPYTLSRTVCIINFLLPKWWNVDVMLIKNINFNEFQTDRIFHLWRLFFLEFLCSLFIIITHPLLFVFSLLFQFLLYVFIFIKTSTERSKRMWEGMMDGLNVFVTLKHSPLCAETFITTPLNVLKLAYTQPPTYLTPPPSLRYSYFRVS